MNVKKLWKSLLNRRQAIDTEDYVVIPRPIMTNFMQFSWIFLLCNYGDEVSTEFDGIPNANFHCKLFVFRKPRCLCIRKSCLKFSC